MRQSLGKDRAGWAEEHLRAQGLLCLARVGKCVWWLMEPSDHTPHTFLVVLPLGKRKGHKVIVQQKDATRKLSLTRKWQRSPSVYGQKGQILRTGIRWTGSGLWTMCKACRSLPSKNKKQA